MRRWLVNRPQLANRKGNWTGRCFRPIHILGEATHVRKVPHDESRPQRQNTKLHTINLELVKAAPPESAQSTRARHVLRAILRECTYLPDEFVRQWVTQYTLSCFRKFEYKVWKHRDDENFRDRMESKKREARQALSQLRRANEGERKCLLKVLLMAYGRIGKRRHDLMVRILPTKGREKLEKAVQARSNGDEVPDLVAEVLESAASGEIGDHGAASIFINDIDSKATYATTDASATLVPSPLRALLRSQMHASPPDLTRPNPKRLTPDIPELNTWLRPMPQSRVRNMKKRHYALLLDRVLPPLPTEEWNHLRDLASGKIKSRLPGPRRSAPLSHSTGRAGVDVTPGSPLEMVVMHGKVPRSVFGNRNAHTITPRFLQRLYAQVFCQCPHMQWDNERKEWKVDWGERALHAPLALSAELDSIPHEGDIAVIHQGDIIPRQPPAPTAAG